MLIFKSDNYKSICRGTSEGMVVKGHRNVTVSTSYQKNETFVRNVTEFDVEIIEMSKENYKIFLDMFRNENDFSFIDTEDVEEGQHYFLDMNEFKLSKIENKKEKNYYYTGSFRISKY